MLNKLILLSPDKMQPWGQPKILPPGAHDYILFGNPEKHELYTFRFQLPASYEIPPFTLTRLCYMTVISGALYIFVVQFMRKAEKLFLREALMPGGLNEQQIGKNVI